jgi:glutaredoxin 3
MDLKIVVYSKSACPQCDSAKMLLKARSLAFDEVKIDD